MALPFDSENPVRKTYFINESERSVDPADDEGKVPQLEENGRVSADLLSGPKRIVYDFADSPATWTKRAGLKRVLVQLWGGGGSGRATRGGIAANATGGGGGAYTEIELLADDLGATETVTVGDGGASVTRSTDGETSGNVGGNSSFGSHAVAYGGGPGTGNTPGGGGQLSAGLGNGTPGNPGVPIVGDGNADSTTATGFTRNGIDGGGAGGGGSNDTGRLPGKSFRGGAGGGGADSFGSRAGAISTYAGNGGNGANSSGASNAVGGDGAFPSGGGGGARNSSTGNAISGKGGAGRVIVTEYY